MREHLRTLLLAILICFLISDLIELVMYIPSTSLSLAPLLKQLLPVKLKQKAKPNEPLTEDGVIKKLNLAPGIGSSKTVQSPVKILKTSPNSKKLTELSAAEAEQLLKAREDWITSMKDHCLPKLVCELHASLTGQNVLSDTEHSILTAIRDTSLGTTAEIVSKYHFAAHMGQLLAGVEGNGCHNFYPNCPIAKTQVLHILKKVKIR